jgi:hypothetical protein
LAASLLSRSRFGVVGDPENSSGRREMGGLPEASGYGNFDGAARFSNLLVISGGAGTVARFGPG